MARLLVVLCVLSLAGVWSADTLSAREGPPPFATHIVVYHDDVDPGAATSDLARGLGLQTESVYRHALKGAAVVVPPGRLEALASDPRVKLVEPNYTFTTFAQVTPTGIMRANAHLNSVAKIDGVDDRVDVDVAIIDTGIDVDHPDLNVVASINCARFGGCASGGNDGNGHGTHVAGTVGALDNSVGVVGMAPGARLWAVRVLNNQGSGQLSWIIAGIDWVTARSATIDVANMSLGCECTSSGMNTAISNSVDSGIVYAVAAGNNAKNAATFSPANHPDVITVSAIADFNGLPDGGAAATCRSDVDDTFADFSNFGSTVEIAAPGVCILSAWLNGGYNTISGTSMASPHVAGAAALYVAEHGKPTDKSGTDAVRSALIAAGTPQNDPDGFTGDPDSSHEPLLNVDDGWSGGGPPPNQPPVADAGDDQSVTVGAGGTTSVTLDGSGSTDPDGDIVSYEWTGAGVDESGAIVTVELGLGTHEITLTVTDDDGATDADTVVMTVNAQGSATELTATLSPSTSSSGPNWTATVTITVTNGVGSPVSGAQVSGSWSTGTAVTCTTNLSGQCPVSISQHKKVGSVSYQVTNVALAGYTYDGGDPSITVNKP